MAHLPRRLALVAILVLVAVWAFGDIDRLNAQTPTLTLSGVLSVIWGDGAPGSHLSRVTLLLTDDSATSTELAIGEPLLESVGGIMDLNGQRVSVTVRAATTRTAAPLQVVTIQRAPGSRSTVAPSPIIGAYPWISVMCKFADEPFEPRSQYYFQNMYAGSYPGLDHYWREQSFGQMELGNSNAVGWYTLPHARGYYVYDRDGDGTLDLDFDRTATDCTAAANRTVYFPNYTGINLMFNDDLDCCSWGGSRTLNLDGTFKSYRVTWLPPWAYGDIAVVAHEMGHGFGLPHSSGDYGRVYDNVWDVMSDTWTGCASSTSATYGCLGQHTIGYHKDKLGWIPGAQKYLISVGSAATLTLERLARPETANFRLVQIPVRGSNTHFYAVEARQRVGYDSKLPADAVVIHEVVTNRGEPAHVVDGDENGDTGDSGAQWLPGETFTDTENGISVTVNAATATGFNISVANLPAMAADLVIAALDYAPAVPVAGDPISYTVRVANQGYAPTTQPFQVGLFVDQVPGDCPSIAEPNAMWQLASLDMGAAQQLTFAGVLTTVSGAHRLYAFADVQCVNVETDSSNNARGPVSMTLASPLSASPPVMPVLLPFVPR